MANTSSRLLRLLSLLQSRRFWGGGELAERLEVSERTLRRDIERLRELGYPVDARRGLDGGYQLAAGASLPPLILDDEEAVALAVGLRAAVQAASVTGIAEASVRALAKVVKVLPAPLRRQVDAVAEMTVAGGWGGSPPTIDSTLLTTVAQACRDSEQLAFSYTARDGQQSERSVEPHRLVLLGRRWYLVAFDLDRYDWRTFRIDRLADAVTTGARSMPRALPGEDAAAFVRAGIENIPPPLVVEAVVHAGADEIRERIGRWASIEEITAERCRVTLSADTADWAVLTLGMTGATFEVLRPAAFRRDLTGWAERLQRAADASPRAAL